MIELFRILRYKTFRHYPNSLSIYVRLCQTTVEPEERFPDNVSFEVDTLLKYRLVGLFPSNKYYVTSVFFSIERVFKGKG